MPTYLDTWSMRKKTGVISLPDQIRLKLWREDPSLISGKDPTQLALYPDTSHWNGPLDVAKMAPWVAAIMAKCSDGKQVIAGGINDLNTYKDDVFDDTVQKAWDNGKPIIAYHYWQPDLKPAGEKSSDRQFSALHNAIDLKVGKAVRELRFDVEETPRLFPGQVKDFLEQQYAWALEEWSDKIPITFYTSTGYLNKWQGILNWLIAPKAVKEIHYAQWVWTQLTKSTWANLYANILPKIEMKVINWAGWLAVQWTSKVYGMEGFNNSEVDLNTHNGTVADLYRRLQWQQGPVTPPPPPPPQTGDYVTRTEFEQYKKHTHPFTGVTG